MAHERFPIAGIVRADVYARETPEPLQVDGDLRQLQAIRRRDHIDSGQAGGRTGKRVRVAQLAAKVEAAEEREDLAEGRARTMHTPREVEAGPRIQHEGGALATTVGGREQEDAAHVPRRALRRDGFGGVLFFVDRGVLATSSTGAGSSRTTEVAGLSARRPRKAG